MNKKIGIAVDDYKIPKFKSALRSAGFTDIEVEPFVDKTSMIFINDVPPERVHDIHKICIKLQTDFRHSN